MLVLAAPTIYGEFFTQYEGRRYFKYFETVDIIIDDIPYTGVILDTCGACSFITHEDRLDLFVSGKQYVIDRGYKGENLVRVSW